MLTPRSFVSSFSLSYPGRGVYTVIPCCSRQILDIEYHINRMYEGLQSIDNHSMHQQFEMQYTPINVFESSHFIQTTISDTTCDLKADLKTYVCENILSLVSKYSDLYANSSMLTICVAKTMLDGRHQLTVSLLLSQRSPYRKNLHNSYFADINIIEYTKLKPTIKYCDWTIERQSIERMNTVTVDEIVMCQRHNDDLQLSEGLVSNIMAIRRDDKFAVVDKDKCLSGSMQKIILDTLKQMDIPSSESTLTLSDLKNYRGLFLTS